ncbi:MAG: CDP-glycerol glycerophosphotransferase family protein [Bacilli bacterium]
MSKIKLLLLKVAIFVLKLIYFVIKLFPTKNKITLISRQSNIPSIDFDMISKEIKKRYPNYEVIVLTKTLDNKIKYIFHMFRQMYHIATSKVVILDSYCIVISVLKHKSKLKVIQAWHAVGSMKKFGYAMLDKKEGSDSKLAKIMRMHKNYDYILISSMNFIKDYEEGFHCNKNQVLEIPLPRVDLWLDKKYINNKRKEVLKNNPKLKHKKNILYCGTFRKNSTNSIEHIQKLVDHIDFKKYNLIYKPHPLSKLKVDDNRIIQNFSNTYEALMVADYVICDYSSIIYEVGLFKLPIYLYAYDWDEYKTQRELNFDIEKEVPTLFTKDPKKIIDAIENNDFDYKAYQKFVDKNIHVPKGGCLNALMDLLDELL